MAIKLTDKPNTEPAGGAYPYGAIKDNIPGVQAGTPINKLVMEDYIQFFHALMDGTSYNDLPENASNGFQYLDALRDYIAENNTVDGLITAGKWIDAGSIVASPDLGSIGTITTFYNRYKIMGKTLFWQFGFSADFSGGVTIININYPTDLTTMGISPFTDIAVQPQVWQGGSAYSQNGVAVLRYYTLSPPFPNANNTIWGNITTELKP